MKNFIPIVVMMLILSSCAPRETSVPAVLETPTLAPAPSFTPTAVTRTLNVCLGEEPNTLYPYGSLNAAARSVLSAIFDGPVDVVEYEYEPIILEKIPNFEDGDAQVSPVTVRAGDRIVDADGDVVLLAAGMKLRPSGCRRESCEITYDGSSPIQMDQIVVTFKMLEGLMWSDGAPLTANDSVYSFEVAGSDDTPGPKFVIDRTQTYETADEFTTQWWGLQGFIDPEYFTNFWMPLPQHLWGESAPGDLNKLDASSRQPVGWGPYILTEWKTGESLHLIKNLNYFRASSSLPHFDALHFLIMPDANAAHRKDWTRLQAFCLCRSRTFCISTHTRTRN